MLLVREWDGDGGVTLVSAADLLEPGYVLPEVAIPIAGLFAGVYAMGVAIIGYRSASVPDTERVLYAVAPILLMVPALFLSPAETLVGIETGGTSVGLVARGVGGVLLAALVIRDRRREREAELDPDAGVDATPPADA